MTIDWVYYFMVTFHFHFPILHLFPLRVYHYVFHERLFFSLTVTPLDVKNRLSTEKIQKNAEEHYS